METNCATTFVCEAAQTVRPRPYKRKLQLEQSQEELIEKKEKRLESSRLRQKKFRNSAHGKVKTRAYDAEVSRYHFLFSGV